MNVDTAEELPTVIAFCAGYGGLERGLELAGVEHRVIAYVEIEAYCVANLVAKMEADELAPAPIYTDLKTFPSELFRGKVSLLTGGYPCQPFSAAGSRKGEDDPRHLWPFIRRHIAAIRPDRVFFENVEGHISLGLNSVLSDLEEDGYRHEAGIFSAREVGAPHQRKRVFIMANRNGVRCNWWKLPDTASQRTVEIEAQQRPRQPVVRSEAKGCCRDSGENVADSRCSASSEGEQQAELRPTGSGESSGGTWNDSATSAYAEGQTWPAGAGPEQYEWEEPRVIWKAESKLGGAVDGSTHRVDRLRLLGNGIVPQTAAKAWRVLSERF